MSLGLIQVIFWEVRSSSRVSHFGGEGSDVITGHILLTVMVGPEERGVETGYSSSGLGLELSTYSFQSHFIGQSKSYGHASVHRAGSLCHLQ